MFHACASLLLVLPAAEPLGRTGTFTLHRADGTSATGPLEQIGKDWSVTLGGDTSSKTAGADVIALRRVGVPLPPYPAEPHVIFANGDRLAGAARALAKEKLTFHTALHGGQDPSLALSDLAVLWLAEPEGADDTALLRRGLLAERRKRDTVRLRNGDVLDGTLAALAKDSVSLEVKRKESKIERGKVAYIALNTDLMRLPRPKGAYGHLVLRDGSRLGLTSATCDGNMLTARTLFGITLQVPVDQVVALDLRQGRAVYLSDLKPDDYQHTPHSAGLSWPYVLDGGLQQGAGATGCDMRLAGSTYDRGVALHTASRLTYKLNGAFRRFEALVGVDDSQPGGAARVQVLVDGKPRDIGRTKDLTGRDGACPVRVDVTGAKELTLVVDFGRGGLKEARVDWADARLIK